MTKGSNWWEENYNSIEQRAYRLYYYDSVNEDVVFSYNSFLEHEISKKYIIIVQREEKLKRILDENR